MDSHLRIYQIFLFRVNLSMLYVLLTNIYSLFQELLLHLEIMHFQLLLLLFGIHYLLISDAVTLSNHFKTLVKTHLYNKEYN